jgi:RNA polymerase sigma factor (sigma-70 family)
LGEVAEYSFTGTLTSPKLIAPDQIARAIARLYTRTAQIGKALSGVLPRAGIEIEGIALAIEIEGIALDLTNRQAVTIHGLVTLPPFQTLLDAHGRDVHRFLIASVGRLDADDCYQETWLAALRAYPRLRDASNLRGWILTIAHRKAIDHHRLRRRDPVSVDEVPELPATAPREHSGELWTTVRKLPPKQRTAVALRYVADAPYEQISAVMGTTTEAARRNVHEGLKRLRMEYQP